MMNMTAREPKLSVVILNWNRKEDSLECLGSVTRSTYMCEIILVDNGSKDDSVIAIRKQFPQVLIMENKENHGFAANNVGIEEALRRGADYVLLLNNDTWVYPECLSRLIEVAERESRAGILSPRICYYSDPDVIWYDGGKLQKVAGFWKHEHIHEGLRAEAVSDVVGEVDYVSGCAMLIRRQVVKKIGGLDQRFFMYWEDGDFSLRARQCGFQLLHVPSALVLHKVSRSSGGWDAPDTFYYMERNRYLMSKKGTPIGAQLSLLKSHLRNCFWEYCTLMRQQKNDHALAIAEVGWDSLLGRFGKRRGKVPQGVLDWLENRRQLS